MENNRQPLEVYFDRYPDIPLEVIIKEDLLRQGLKFTEAAMQAAETCRRKSYFLFSYDRISHDEMEQDEGSRVPEDIDFFGGSYGLKRTVVRVSIGSDTPYTIDADPDGEITLYEDEKPLAKVEYPSVPEYYAEQFEDGTSYGQMIPLLFGRQAFATIHRFCALWGANEECKFCDINGNLRDLKKKHKDKPSDHVVFDAIKDPDKVATVMEAMTRSMFIENRESIRNRMVCLIMTAGTIKTTLKGMTPNQFHLSYLNAIRDKIGGRTPLVLIVEPGSREDMIRLHEAGCTSYNPNYEVWDSKMVKIRGPGKGNVRGREE